jgi:GR25 family glycosyltransferase involved in LPS biosynthesis
VADIFKSFDKIYCINLPFRKDRWQNCLLQFEKYNISNNLQKFDGIIYNNPLFNKKQNAHLGCWFSHYTILKHAKAMNYDKILILEDDFVFNVEPKKLNDKLTCCVNELPQNWDLFYLGAYFVKGYDYEAKINYSENLYKANTAFCTHSICYSKFGIQKIIQSMEKTFLSLKDMPSIYESIGWFYVKEFLYENNCFASKEFLCGQEKGFSDIENCIVDYNDYFLKGYES